MLYNNKKIVITHLFTIIQSEFKFITLLVNSAPTILVSNYAVRYKLKRKSSPSILVKKSLAFWNYHWIIIVGATIEATGSWCKN